MGKITKIIFKYRLTKYYFFFKITLKKNEIKMY